MAKSNQLNMKHKFITCIENRPLLLMTENYNKNWRYWHWIARVHILCYLSKIIIEILYAVLSNCEFVHRNLSSQRLRQKHALTKTICVYLYTCVRVIFSYLNDI